MTDHIINPELMARESELREALRDAGIAVSALR